MLAKLLREALFIFLAAGLLFWGFFRPDTRTQALTHNAYAEGNAPGSQAVTIYIQPVDPNGKLLLSSWRDPDGSDNDQYIWDNFTLQSTATITEIDWFGVYDPARFGAGGPVLDFSVKIYASIAAGTEPAIANPPLVEYRSGGNAGETAIGTAGGTLYAYAFNLPTPFVAISGTKYWVQIEAFQHGSIPDWCLAAGRGGDGSHYRRVSGAGGDIRYLSAPGDAAFTLVGLELLKHNADTTGVFRPGNGLLYLKNQNTTGTADIAINYGLGGDYPVVGDWDGDGITTIGIYRGTTFYLRNENTIGFATIVFDFGQAGDQPIAGDWDGDGDDTIGIYRPSIGQFLLRNSNDAGPAEMSFYLGNAGDVGIVGDWNGDGMDTTGVFRPENGIIFLKNTNDTGFADYALNYGLSGDKPVIGDWNGDGIDTIGIFRNGTFYLRNSNTIGFAEILFDLGIPDDHPIAGDWDGLP